MNRQRTLIVGVTLLLTGIPGFTILPGSTYYAMGMRGGMMMNDEGMKDMMKTMLGSQLPLGIDPQQLPEAQSKGAQLMQRYCIQCHELPSPGLHTVQEWSGVYQRMLSRMQTMSNHGMMGMMHDIKAPTDTESEELLAYIQAHAQKAMDPTKYADLESPAGQLFQNTCSQCHALPDPKQHKTEEWPLVVQRMTNNMQTMQVAVPDKQTLESIIGYLQKHTD